MCGLLGSALAVTAIGAGLPFLQPRREDGDMERCYQPQDPGWVLLLCRCRVFVFDSTSSFFRSLSAVISHKSAWMMTCAFERGSNQLVACGGLDNVCSVYSAAAGYPGSSIRPQVTSSSCS
jgi:hypothetical protein